jgi:hypothetical protein
MAERGFIVREDLFDDNYSAPLRQRSIWRYHH